MRTCFFLGAGASAEFGYPTTARILPLIRTRLHNHKLFRADRKRSVQRCTKLEKFLTNLLPGFAQASEAALPNIVELLSLLDHSLRSSTTPIPRVAVTEIAEVRSLLEVAICDVIRQGEEGRRPGSPMADKFWQCISRRNVKQKDSLALISTNYDTSVEQLISDNLGLRQIVEQVDFGFSWRDPDHERPHPSPPKPWLRFYKLHGSLNWLRCDLCEHIYLNSAFDIYHRVLDSKIVPDNRCHCGHGKLSLMLLTPSYVRDVREPNLLTIWRNALELLRTSDKWVMVGYSLPPDDVDIRSMLMRAAQGRHKPPKVTVVLDRNRPDVFARYQLLFPDMATDTRGFAAYINDLSAQ